MVKKDTNVLVKAMIDGEWKGDWVPLHANMEWMRDDGRIGLFSLTEVDTGEDAELEYAQLGSLVLGVLEDDVYKVRAGVPAQEI